MRTIRRIRE
jgi:NADPH-dependent 2,4-dienoyl-CoA reductase/sulfur reductase-like enzyme